MSDLHDVRWEYSGEPLTRSTADSNPLHTFTQWMALAQEYHPEDATAMVLATASSGGLPSARTVLLKQFDESGFCWYSNSGSQKGQHLAENPRAQIQFYWRRLHRQVRIRGHVVPLSRANAERYFHARPLGSQISAAVSRQSKVVESRETLELAADALAAQYQGAQIPCPDDWCGWALQPDEYEFWQGRENRLHDRLEYLRSDQGWTISRLAP